MSSAFKRFQPVRVRPKPVEGIVEQFGMDPSTGERQVLVTWAADGADHSRWFAESDLEDAMPTDDTAPVAGDSVGAQGEQA